MKTSPIQSEYYDAECRWGETYNCPHIDRYRVPFPHKIPWEDAERAYKSYSRRYGTSQSLERLSERGGFGAFEFCMFFYDVPDNEDFWDYRMEYCGAYCQLRGYASSS